MLPSGLPSDFPSFIARFGTEQACREHLFHMRWPAGFACAGCGALRCYAHKKRNIYECAACGKQHSLLAGTIFEQTKSPLVKWFLAIYFVTSSKRGISAAELKRHLGFGSDQTAWVWLHKIRRAMVAPGRAPLEGPIEADECFIGAPRPGRPGRGAAGKTAVACAVEKRWIIKGPKPPVAPLRGIARTRALACRPEARMVLGRVRLAHAADTKAATLLAFLGRAAGTAAEILTDANAAYGGLTGLGFRHRAVNLSKTWGDALVHLPAVHLVIGHVKRWLLGTYHGGVSPGHLDRYLDEFAFRFNRRTAQPIAHRFQRLLEIAVVTTPSAYRHIVLHPGNA